MLRVALAALLSFSAVNTVAAQEVNISGSTSVARVMDVLAEQYNTSCTGLMEQDTLLRDNQC